MSEQIAKILEVTMELNEKTKEIHKQNQQLRQKLSLDSYSQSSFDFQFEKTPIQIKIEQKKRELKEKQEQLIKAQMALLETKFFDQPVRKSVDSTLAIPVALNQVQKFIMQLTDVAIENHGSVPITSLLKIVEALHRIIDILEEDKTIIESEEEKNSRCEFFLHVRKQILEKMKQILSDSSSKPESQLSKLNSTQPKEDEEYEYYDDEEEEELTEKNSENEEKIPLGEEKK